MSVNVVVATTSAYLDIFIEKRLSVDGHNVTKTNSGKELLEAVNSQETSLVIVQSDVAEINGFAATETLKKSEKTQALPVIFISTSIDDEKSAIKVGADVFLRIPFGEAEFIDAVNHLLETKKRILLVDDSTVIHKRTGDFLRKSGYIVIDAYNGLEGCEMAISEIPDLIISDIEMPVMDGFTMCKKIKNNDRTALIPIVMVSSMDKGIDIDRGFDAGANDYLIKPVVHEELLTCINNLVNTMEMRRNENILIVDNSKTIVNMLKLGLTRQGFQVTAFSDGEAAYESAIKTIPDLILSDLDMPKLDGYQLVKYLKEKPETRNIPVIIISSRESRAEAAKGLRIGASAFISKPFSMDKILINVERLTAEQRLIREREAMKLYMSEAAMDAARKSSQKHSSEYSATEKPLTILFSDIVGFTSMCEKNKPMETVKLLNDYLDAMTTVLKAHGAVIDKFIGDSIMAIFAADSSGEIPHFRAVAAALEMLDEQKGFNKTHDKEVKTRIGINSGRVIFGDIGSRFYRRDFTVIGDNVNTAQRLQAAADPDTVLISESVYSRIKARAQVIDKGTLTLKGKDVKIQTYQVEKLTR